MLFVIIFIFTFKSLFAYYTINNNYISRRNELDKLMGTWYQVYAWARDNRISCDVVNFKLLTFIDAWASCYNTNGTIEAADYVEVVSQGSKKRYIVRRLLKRLKPTKMLESHCYVEEVYSGTKLKVEQLVLRVLIDGYMLQYRKGRQSLVAVTLFARTFPSKADLLRAVDCVKEMEGVGGEECQPGIRLK